MGSCNIKTTVGERKMHKFFIDKSAIFGDAVQIEGEDVNHISKVLRLRKGENIQVCDGNRHEYICMIESIEKKLVTCRIIESFDNLTEAPIEITLFQGIPKSQKMDLIVQKCVEIGVVKIQPVITERVVVKTDGKDLSSKIERWNRIAVEASKQSNRGILPVVEEPVSFDEAIVKLKEFDAAVIPYENEKTTGMKEYFKNKREIKSIGILIGPEGGFEESEIELCMKNNIMPVTLGPRILRTETAGFVASTIVLYEIGDMGGVK